MSPRLLPIPPPAVTALVATAQIPARPRGAFSRRTLLKGAAATDRRDRRRERPRGPAAAVCRRLEDPQCHEPVGCGGGGGRPCRPDRRAGDRAGRPVGGRARGPRPRRGPHGPPAGWAGRVRGPRWPVGRPIGTGPGAPRATIAGPHPRPGRRAGRGVWFPGTTRARPGSSIGTSTPPSTAPSSRSRASPHPCQPAEVADAEDAWSEHRGAGGHRAAGGPLGRRRRRSSWTR